MKNFVKKIDLVGFIPRIYFQKENKFQTWLGGIFTLLICILTIFAAFSFGDDIYKKNNPNILLNKKFIEPLFNLTQQNIIGFRLFYTGGVKIEELDKLVDIFLLHSQFDPKLSKAVVTRYEIIKCSQAEIYKNNYLNLTMMIGNPDDYYCLPNNTTLFLQGKYGAPVNNHMHLRVGICKNNTENKNRCYPDDIIRKKMSSFFVSFIYCDSYIDGKDYENPVKYYITSNTLKSSSYTFRQDSYLFKDVTFITDSGVILQDKHVQDYTQLDTISSGSTAESNTETFTNVIVGLNNLKDIYNRKYVKIQDISAQVGGIIKLFLIFSEFFLSFYSYIPFLESLYSKLFDYDKIFKDGDNILDVNSSSSGLFHQNLQPQNFKYNPFFNSTNLITEKKQNFLKSNEPIQKINEEIFNPTKIVKKTYSSKEIIFRTCYKGNKNNGKFRYLEKIVNHYKINYDVERLFLYQNKLNHLYEFIFNKLEQEVLYIFGVTTFFETYKELNSNENTYNYNIWESKIFEKLKIPKGLMKLKVFNKEIKNLAVKR